MHYQLKLTSLAAANYNCGSYGAGNYNENQCQATTPSGGGTPSTGTEKLAYTGYDIIIPLALGGALIVAAVILFVKKIRLQRKQD